MVREGEERRSKRATRWAGSTLGTRVADGERVVDGEVVERGWTYKGVGRRCEREEQGRIASDSLPSHPIGSRPSLRFVGRP